MFRTLGTVLVALLAAGSTLMTFFLIKVGNHAHWTSDGPGMLFIMIGVGVFGMAALGFWKALLSLLFGGPTETPAAKLPDFEIRFPPDR